MTEVRREVEECMSPPGLPHPGLRPPLSTVWRGARVGRLGGHLHWRQAGGRARQGPLERWGDGSDGAIAQGPGDCGEHVIEVGRDLFVVEPKYDDVAGFEELLAKAICFGLMFVDRTVDFDGDPGRNAVEIDDEAADRVLAPELEPCQPLSAEGVPQRRLCRCRAAPQLARERHLLPPVFV